MDTLLQELLKNVANVAKLGLEEPNQVTASLSIHNAQVDDHLVIGAIISKNYIVRLANDRSFAWIRWTDTLHSPIHDVNEVEIIFYFKGDQLERLAETLGVTVDELDRYEERR